MAFMALFGWILIPVLLLYALVVAVTAPIRWAAANPGAAYAIAAGALALNLGIFLVLRRVRKRRRSGGRKGGWVLLLASLWEAWVVLLCALFLIVRPLRFIPEDFGTPLNVQSVCFDEWEVVSCQGVPQGYTCTQEEIDRWIGARVAYGEDLFTAGSGEVFGLPPVGYRQGTHRREEGIHISGSTVSTSFEGIGLDCQRIRWARVNYLNPPSEVQFGDTFYILDRDTLMIYFDCAFYLARRAEAAEMQENPS